MSCQKYRQKRVKNESEREEKAEAAEMRVKMEPKITRRQQIVKNITIVFLLVLLVLTFFSNTIMNMTLTEVMLGEIRPETITTQVYASGIVQANDVYQLTMTESRVVENISVSEGAAVREGDVLFYLEGEEDENLKSMKTNAAAFNHQWESIQNLPLEVMKTDEVTFPYWENEARGWMFFRTLSLLICAAWSVFLAFGIGRAGIQWRRNRAKQMSGKYR